MLYENSGLLSFDINHYKQFLKTCDRFDENNQLIIENRNLLIDIPVELLQYCFNNQNKPISFDKIKQLMKNSKHYNNIKNSNINTNTHFSVFNFSDDLAIKSFHFKCFKIVDDDLITAACNLFKQECESCSGFCGEYFTGDYIICINSNTNSNVERAIYHELSHFIQMVCNIRITLSTEFKSEINLQNQVLDELNIDLNKLIYYFDSKEFTTHVDELVQGLYLTYITYYNNKHIVLYFLDDVLQSVKNKNVKQSTFFQRYIEINNGDYAPLAMFIGSYWTKFKFQKISDLIKRSLIKLSEQTGTLTKN